MMAGQWLITRNNYRALKILASQDNGYSELALFTAMHNLSHISNALGPSVSYTRHQLGLALIHQTPRKIEIRLEFLLITVCRSEHT